MTYKRGQSGNPSGRPKGYAEFQSHCRARAPGWIERIERMATHSKDETIRLAALRYLVDRGYGKPLAAHAVMLQDASSRAPSFVLRLPAPMDSAADWEAQVNADRDLLDALDPDPQVIDVTPQPVTPPPVMPPAQAATAETPTLRRREVDPSTLEEVPQPVPGGSFDAFVRQEGNARFQGRMEALARVSRGEYGPNPMNTQVGIITNKDTVR